MIEAVFAVLMVVGIVAGWKKLVVSLANKREISEKTAKWVSTVVWGIGLLFGVGILIALPLGGYTTWIWLRDKVRESKRKPRTVPVATRQLSRAFDVIRFEYKGREDFAHLQRTVEVTGMDKTYFEGMCRARQSERTFRFDRVRGEVVSMETGEIYPSAAEWRDEYIDDPRNRGVSPVPKDAWKRDR